MEVLPFVRAVVVAAALVLVTVAVEWVAVAAEVSVPVAPGVVVGLIAASVVPECCSVEQVTMLDDLAAAAAAVVAAADLLFQSGIK